MAQQVEGIVAEGDPVGQTDPIYIAGKDTSGNLVAIPIDDGGNIPVAISDPKIDIEDDGVPVTNTPHAILNFTGAGVTATDAGSNRVDIDIPGGGVGSGDVTGPVSSTDEAVARYDGVTGKVIQNSSVSIDDSGNIATSGTVDGRDVSADGSILDTHVADMNNPHGTQEGVNLEDEGLGVTGTPHTTLNFTGAGVTVTDAGSGEATVDIPGFGSEYHYAQNTTVSSTTSSTFVNYMSLVTGTVPAGTYRIGVTLVWSQSTTSDKFSARVTLNGSSIIFDPAGSGEMQQEPKDKGADQRHPASGFQNTSLGAGSHTINIDFRQQDGNTAFIYNAAIEFWRVI